MAETIVLVEVTESQQSHCASALSNPCMLVAHGTMGKLGVLEAQVAGKSSGSDCARTAAMYVLQVRATI